MLRSCQKYRKTNRQERSAVSLNGSLESRGTIADAGSYNRFLRITVSCEIINSCSADLPLSVWYASYAGNDSNAIYYGALRVYQGQPGHKYAIPFAFHSSR